MSSQKNQGKSLHNFHFKGLESIDRELQRRVPNSTMVGRTVLETTPKRSKPAIKIHNL